MKSDWSDEPVDVEEFKVQSLTLSSAAVEGNIQRTCVDVLSQFPPMWRLRNMKEHEGTMFFFFLSVAQTKQPSTTQADQSTHFLWTSSEGLTTVLKWFCNKEVAIKCIRCSSVWTFPRFLVFCSSHLGALSNTAESLLHPEACSFSMWTSSSTAVVAFEDGGHVNKWNDRALSLWKCNNEVFLECGKQIRLGGSCLIITQTESRLGVTALALLLDFTWPLVVNQNQHHLGTTDSSSSSSIFWLRPHTSSKLH